VKEARLLEDAAWVRIKDDGPTGQTTGQWGDPSSAVSSGSSSGPSFRMWLKDDGPMGQTTGQWVLWNVFGIANTLI